VLILPKPMRMQLLSEASWSPRPPMGTIIGGMVYQLDPELEMPINDLTPEQEKEGCPDKAKELLACLGLPSEKVKCARVRKIAIDVEMKSDDCCY
jgi:hypothetical protein